MISTQADWQFPELPAKWLRQHPDYHFLGFSAGKPCYVCELSRHEFDDGQLQRVPLRRLIGAALSDADFSMASRALQFLSWRQNHRFCSRCGSPTEPHPRDLAMTCAGCGYFQYPRITRASLRWSLMVSMLCWGVLPAFPKVFTPAWPALWKLVKRRSRR